MSCDRRQRMTPLAKRLLKLERHIERTERVQNARRAMLRKLRDPRTPADDVQAILDFHGDR
jgi:hypothetical protein